MRHQKELSILMIQIHAQDRGDRRLVDGQLAPTLLPERATILEGKQIEKISRVHHQLVRHLPLCDFLQHKQDRFIFWSQSQHSLSGDFAQGLFAPLHLDEYAHGNPSLQAGLAPAIGESQQDSATKRTRGAGRGALEKGLGLDLAQMLRTTLLLFEFAFTLRIVMPCQECQPQGNDMGTDDPPLHIVAAGTQIITGVIGQDIRSGLDGAATPGNGSFDERLFIRGIQYQSALEQGLPIPEGDVSPPALQHLVCKRQFHLSRPALI